MRVDDDSVTTATYWGKDDVVPIGTGSIAEDVDLVNILLPRINRVLN